MSRSYKKRSCKIFTAPFITKPLTSNWKQAASFLSLYYWIALKSSGFSDARLGELLTRGVREVPAVPYQLRTGGRLDTYTPASAALPSQPLYPAAFERVRGLHSLTT